MNDAAVRIEHLRWNEALATHRARWSALVEALELNPTLLPGWMDCVVRSHGREADFRVALAWQRGALVGFIPYWTSSERVVGLPLLTVHLGANLVAYHHALVVEPSAMRQVIGAFLDSAELGAWHVLRAMGVEDPGATANAFVAVADARSMPLVKAAGDSSPFAPLAPSWEGFRAGLSKNFRKNLRRRARQLDAAGRVTMSWPCGEDDVAGLLEDVHRIEARSWKHEAGIAVGSRDHERRYYELLLPWLAANEMLFANVLRLDETPIAFGLCYQWQRRIGSMKTSYDAACDALAPGLAIKHAAFERAHELGASEFDFLGDAVAHKLHWTRQVRRHSNLELYSRRAIARLVGLGKRLHRGAHARR